MQFWITTTILCLITGHLMIAQNVSAPYSITPRHTNEKIVADGVLDEAVWQSAPMIADFWQQFPQDSIRAQSNTEIRMLYDDQNIYIAVTCYSIGGEWVVQSLKRDFSFPGSDNITLLFDTYVDKTNAFVFGMNPYGVKREAVIANGGRQRTDFQSSWDNKWTGNATKHNGHWIGEFQIPFSTLRFKEGSTEWRFNCYRSDTQFNEWTTWSPIPRNRLVMDLSFMGKILWDQPLRKTGGNMALIPYVSGGTFRDFEDPTESGADYDVDIGGDAKIAITSGLNLDLTANPDFSQVEVDAQVTNLDRFEIFFPERRQFFLENADLFGSFGLTRVNPFFSRRIGVALDTATGQNIQNPILFGARVSGKLNNNMRVGILNMQTASEKGNGLPSFNYSVATLQQKVFDRSNISMILVNKQAVNASDFSGEFNRYNRVAGIEYRLASADNRWAGKVFYHHAFSPNKLDHPFSQGFQIENIQRKFRWEWAHLFIGNGYNAEVGFVPRKDFLLFSPEVQFYFYPESDWLAGYNFNLDTRIFFDVGKNDNDVLPPWTHSELQIELTCNFQLKNNVRGEIQIVDNHVTLLNDFDPTRLQDEGVFLPAGSKHHFLEFSASYGSDERKSFSFDVAPTIGQFYNGFRAGLEGSLQYRFQPYGSVALHWNYDHIALDDPFEAVDIWLVGPRVDLTFSKSVFLTTFVQYNNQLDNLNINTRLQWRYAPVSDLFLVYTDNYLVDSLSQFAARNRALVLKLTYWLNV